MGIAVRICFKGKSEPGAAWLVDGKPREKAPTAIRKTRREQNGRIE
jgi:hypothetical protein